MTADQYRNPRTRDVPAKITQYLSNGGLVNPELMDHEAVRDLLIHARDVIEIFERERRVDSQPTAKASNQRAKETIATLRSMLERKQPLYCNEIRIAAETVENLLAYITELEGSPIPTTADLREDAEYYRHNRDVMGAEWDRLRQLLIRFVISWESLPGHENMDRLCEIARGLGCVPSALKTNEDADTRTPPP